MEKKVFASVVKAESRRIGFDIKRMCSGSQMEKLKAWW